MENWRPVTTHVGYYEVSDLGRVRSVERVAPVAPSKKAPLGYKRTIAARILIPCPSGARGTYKVSLWKAHELRMEAVHVLVLEAFVGRRPADAPYGCHRDDRVDNNTLGNLYWGTPKENSDDKVRNGNQPYGEACTSAKITTAQVKTIRAAIGSASQEAIGALHGISQAQVSRIAAEKHWKDV